MTALVRDFVRSSPADNGLCIEDKVVLTNWLSKTLRVNAIVDFSDRPWNIGPAGPILGVFREGNERASWLIVRSGTQWGLARCDDGWVAPAAMSLSDALESIESAA